MLCDIIPYCKNILSCHNYHVVLYHIAVYRTSSCTIHIMVYYIKLYCDVQYYRLLYCTEWYSNMLWAAVLNFSMDYLGNINIIHNAIFPLSQITRHRLLFDGNSPLLTSVVWLFRVNFMMLIAMKQAIATYSVRSHSASKLSLKHIQHRW